MTRPIALFGLLFATLLGTSSVQAQTTQPARGARQRVLVMQFAPLDDSSARHATDVGSAIQRSLIADLGTSRGVDALSPAAGPQVVAPSDAQGALQEARRLDVDVVVWGNYQVLDPELRITGQVIDVRREQPPLARIRATGTLHDLFRMQDRLTIQVCRAIGVPVPREVLSDARDSSRDTQPGNNDYGQPPQQQQQMAPDQTPYQQYQEPDNYSYSYPPYYGPATYSYDYPAYNYAPYYYPYYSYPYYYPSFGFFFSNSFHNHGHDDHHDGHHDGHDGHHDGFSNGFHGSSGFHGGSAFHGSSGFHGSSMGGFHGSSMGGFGGFRGGGGMSGGGHMGGGMGGGGGHR